MYQDHKVWYAHQWNNVVLATSFHVNTLVYLIVYQDHKVWLCTPGKQRSAVYKFSFQHACVLYCVSGPLSLIMHTSETTQCSLQVFISTRLCTLLYIRTIKSNYAHQQNNAQCNLQAYPCMHYSAKTTRRITHNNKISLCCLQAFSMLACFIVYADHTVVPAWALCKYTFAVFCALTIANTSSDTNEKQIGWTYRRQRRLEPCPARWTPC